MPKNMYLLDKQTGQMHPVPEEEYIKLGRSRTKIPLPKDEKYKSVTKGVSRAHCKLIRQDLLESVVQDQKNEIEVFPSGLGVADLGSRNGTYVNGSRVREKPCPLNSGDILTLCMYEFRVVIEEVKPLTEPIKSTTTTVS